MIYTFDYFNPDAFVFGAGSDQIPSHLTPHPPFTSSVSHLLSTPPAGTGSDGELAARRRGGGAYSVGDGPQRDPNLSSPLPFSPQAPFLIGRPAAGPAAGADGAADRELQRELRVRDAVRRVGRAGLPKHSIA